jgi:hypothetical protein
VADHPTPRRASDVVSEPASVATSRSGTSPAARQAPGVQTRPVAGGGAADPPQPGTEWAGEARGSSSWRTASLGSTVALLAVPELAQVSNYVR